MKKLLVIMLGLMLAAGSAYALETEISGDFSVRGQGLGEVDLNDAADVDFYTIDQDLNILTKISVDDNTFVSFRTAIHDETWQDTSDNWTTGNRDADISVERSWMGHTFANTDTKLEVGLMTGNAWGTAFGDAATGVYKIQAQQKLDFGMLVAYIQKEAEVGGSDEAEDSEDDDGDTYAVGLVMPINNITISPIIGYSNRSDLLRDTDNDGVQVFSIDVAVTGTFNNIGFEAEVDYESYSLDTGATPPQGDVLPGATDDFALWGAYLNVWAQLNQTKLGGLIAYGSWDDDSDVMVGYDFDDDFDKTLVLGDQIGFGDDSAASQDGMTGMTLLQIYVDHAFNEKLSAGGSISYVLSNQEDDPRYEDATAWEIDVNGAYKITDNLTYSVAAGYASVDFDVTGLSDPDPAWRAFHKLSLTF